MKAIINERYGSPDILKYMEIDNPIPKENEVLIKVKNASVNAGDWHLMRGEPFMIRLMFGLLKPKIRLGSDFAGIVEAVGNKVTDFKVGDEVFGNLSEYGFGTFAEYVCSTEEYIAHKPNNMNFEQAAAVPMAATTALQALRDKGKINAGQKVLINGASGGVGLFAVQIAKSFGAEVTGVCSSNKMETVLSAGADNVIDYKKEDFTKSGLKYDLILAANGFHPISEYKKSLTPQGIYVMTGGAMKQLMQTMLLGPILSEKNGKQLGNILQKTTKKDLLFLKELLESKKIEPIIDKRFDLSRTSEAIEYLEEGHALGKVIITI